MPVWEREEVQKMLRPAWSLTLAPHAKTSPALRQTPGWLDPDLVLTANLWVQSALTANYMGPTGQLLRAASTENKGPNYTARPIYGSNRGQFMGLVTIL